MPTQFMSPDDLNVCDVDDDGTFHVAQLARAMVRETRSTPEGGIAVAVLPATQVFKGLSDEAARSIFDANFAGGRFYNVDINCGAQRFNGAKNQREVRAALRQCGFDVSQINTIIRLAKGHTHKSVSQRW